MNHRAASRQNAVDVVRRLQRFRQQMERDMEPEPWTALEAPVVLLLSDVCEALALTEEERATVLGTAGVTTLIDELEVRIRPISRPRPSMNERNGR